jgi:hypothetical protein
MARPQFNIKPKAQQQQGGGGFKDLASLMELLGLGSEQGLETRKEETAAKSQQALQAYYEGLVGQQKAGTEAQTATEREKLGLQEKQLAAQERAALAAELAQREAKEFQQQATLRDIAAKDLPKLQEALAGRDAEEKEILLKAANVKEGLEEIAKKRQGKFTTGLGKAYEGFAKDPKAIAAFLKAQENKPGYEEMVKSADWQTLNQGLPAAQPGLLSRLFGGAGTPAAVTASSVGPATVGNYGPMAAPEAPEYRYGTGTRVIPAVGGIEKPVTVPAEFRYEEGYPSAKPNYMYGIKTPIPADVINRVESDPRYRSAEQDVLLAIKDWWNRERAPSEAINAVGSEVTPYRYGTGAQEVPPTTEAAPPFVSSGGPSAMPGVIQQPGFLENLLNQISDYTASRPERVPAERYPYPIGHGVPPPVGGATIDPRLLQP